MRATTKRQRRMRTALVLAALGLLLPAGAPAEDMSIGILVADHRSDNWDDDWDDWDQWDTLLRMQREAISSQEEAAREAGRALRREELEQSRGRAAAEREAYFDAIIESSRASLKAPTGVPYRKPGYTSREAPPENTPVVAVRGIPYLYDQGIFWLQQGDQYIVVTAPVGAVVARPPRGSVPVIAAERPLWYYFGTFFAEAAGGYAVVSPPVGATVFYLPDGYRTEKAGGVDVFRFGDTFYRPVFIQGVLAYQVTGG